MEDLFNLKNKPKAVIKSYIDSYKEVLIPELCLYKKEFTRGEHCKILVMLYETGLINGEYIEDMVVNFDNGVQLEAITVIKNNRILESNEAIISKSRKFDSLMVFVMLIVDYIKTYGQYGIPYVKMQLKERLAERKKEDEIFLLQAKTILDSNNIILDSY